MNNALPLDLSALDELPNTTYWNRDARMEYFGGRQVLVDKTSQDIFL